MTTPNQSPAQPPESVLEKFERWWNLAVFAHGADKREAACDGWLCGAQAARREALEEAAKVCEAQASLPECPYQPRPYCAEAIRSAGRGATRPEAASREP